MSREFADQMLMAALQVIPKSVPLPEGWEKTVSPFIMLKKDLKDGIYYYGYCRNARVARWDAEGECRFYDPKFGKDVVLKERGRFVYIRTKFGCQFPESINHPENDNGFDFFIPVCVIEPTENERVSDESLRSTF